MEQAVMNMSPGKFQTGILIDDFIQAMSVHRQFRIQKVMHDRLVFEGLKRRILLVSNILETLTNLIGPDLQYCLSSDVMVNVKGVQDDFLVKKAHQELWSGLGLNTLQTWAPIIMDRDEYNTRTYGMDVIPGSHLSGHIPHQNCQPLITRPEQEWIPLELEVGDMVIFHSLLLHRTVPNESDTPRFAIPQLVRSSREPDTGFEDLMNWEILHMSDMSLIRKKLGNPHLSPFG
jgi:hypothetical protein